MISKGDNIKGYIVEKRIGSGGFGDVLLVHDEKDASRKFALKIIRSNYLRNMKIRESFLNEMINMARMSKQINTVKIINSIIYNDDDGERIGMVTEYIEGDSLDKFVTRNVKLNHYIAVSIFIQMVDAIGEAHRHDIIHRDIKPSNVIIESSKIIDYKGYETHPVKILDFGLSKTLEGSTVTESLSGATLVYSAPERLKKNMRVDHRADIYSLGATFFEMLTGAPPFGGKGLAEVLEQINKTEISSLPGFETLIDTGLDKVIMKAMSRTPLSRFKSCEEISREIMLAFPPENTGEKSTTTQPDRTKNDKEVKPERDRKMNKTTNMSGDLSYDATVRVRDDALIAGSPGQDVSSSRQSHIKLSIPGSHLGHKALGHVESIKSCMAKNRDFPVMSRTIGIISRLLSATIDTTTSELANVILDDFALTGKLLKMANSAFFSRYGSKVSTISHAILILGLDQVQKAALSMMLFEDLKEKTTALKLKDAVLTTFLSGAIARNMSAKVGLKADEEAFICSLFHKLGKLLIIFYLPNEEKSIRETIARSGVDEETASRSVLGLSFEELGIIMASEWNFPEQIVQSMHSLPPTKIPAPGTIMDQLRTLVCFANELSTFIRENSFNNEAQQKDLKKLVERYDNCFSLNDEDISEILESSLKEVVRYASLYTLDIKESPLLSRIERILESGKKEQDSVDAVITVEPYFEETKQDETDIEDSDETNVTGLKATGLLELDGISDPEVMLARGIQEISQFLLEDYSYNDLLGMILEVMYRALNFSRVLICIKNNSKPPVMEARFGFGNDIEETIRKFRFTIRSSSDVFNLCLSKASDIMISDIDDKKIMANIPEWYRKLIKAKTFMLLPIVVNKVSVGMIYADKQRAGEIEMTPLRIKYLQTLRKQAILAILEESDKDSMISF